MRFVSACLVSVLLGCTADTFVGGDGGTDAADEAAAPLLCGASTCKAVDTCCIYTNNGSAQYQCQLACTPAQNGAQLSALSCTSSADCGGQACCIRRASGGGNVSSCETACSASKNEVQLCDPAAPNPGCPSSAPCSPNNVADWGLPSGFGTCGGQGPP